MSRYRDSVCKLCRNEGQKLFLKGSRCYSAKCAIEKRPYPSGAHGKARKKLSEYAVQLREKQKLRRTFSIQEKQFRRYYHEAVRRQGVTGTVLFQLLESRLDNVVFRSGLVPSRAQARQLVTHGHFLVNGKKVDIPSYLVRVGDLVTPKDGSKALIKALAEEAFKVEVPRWLEVDRENLAVRVMALVEREDVDPNIQENLIIEFYSR